MTQGPSRWPVLRSALWRWGSIVAATGCVLVAMQLGDVWQRSYHCHSGMIYLTAKGTAYSIESCRGTLYLHVESDAVIDHMAGVFRIYSGGWDERVEPPYPSPFADIIPIWVARVKPSYATGKIAYLQVSDWLAVLLLLLPAWFCVRRHLRLYMRHRRRQCVRCGYALRTCAAECPECGLPTPWSKQVMEQIMSDMNRVN